MGYLKRMVREQSHVVIASIHQPRSAIWLMFDAVGRGGGAGAWATLGSQAVGGGTDQGARAGTDHFRRCQPQAPPAPSAPSSTRPPLPRLPAPAQVTLLASGRLMYHGPREGITAWFGSLGYNYDPNLHGVPSDW
jgi:hypothetical protein